MSSAEQTKENIIPPHPVKEFEIVTLFIKKTSPDDEATDKDINNAINTIKRERSALSSPVKPSQSAITQRQVNS